MKTADYMERELVCSRTREHELERSRSVLMYMEAVFIYTLAFAPQTERVRQSLNAAITSFTVAGKQAFELSQLSPANSNELVSDELHLQSNCILTTARDSSLESPRTTDEAISGHFASASASEHSDSCCSTSPKYNTAPSLEQQEQREWRRRIEQLLNDLPSHTQKVAGKSLPSEKFVVRRAARYRERGGILTLPAIELMYLWPTFRPLSTRPDLLGNLIDHVEATLQLLEPVAKQVKNQQDSARFNPKAQQDGLKTIANPFFWDEYALAWLLKGALLRVLRRYMEVPVHIFYSKSLLLPDILYM